MALVAKINNLYHVPLLGYFRHYYSMWFILEQDENNVHTTVHSVDLLVSKFISRQIICSIWRLGCENEPISYQYVCRSHYS